MGPTYASLCMRTQIYACVRTALMARLQMVITHSFKSKLENIFIQIDAVDVYFPMKQTTLKNSLWIKSYGKNNKQRSFFTNVFKAI